MATPVQHRRDSAADWTSNDPVLLDGQIGIESDTGKFKFGDGITAWTSLDYRNVDSVLGAITGIIQSDGAGNLSAASAGTDYAAAADVDDLVTLSGVAANSANFGTFTGDTLGDTETVKTALQTLETAVDTLIGTSGHDLVTLDVNADTLLSLSTQELGLDVQNANKVLAGPTTGADAVPAFRDLVADDIPDISAVYEPVLPAKTDKALMTLRVNVTEDALEWAAGTGVSFTVPTSDGAYSGIPRPGVAGETLAVGQPVYLSSSTKLLKAQSDVAGTSRAVGIIVVGGDLDEAVTYISEGYLYLTAWNWTVGSAEKVFVDPDTAGALTQTALAETEQMQEIGYGYSAKVLQVSINSLVVEIGDGLTHLVTEVTGVLPTANGGTGVANNAASTLTISGNYATTLTVTAETGVTLPTTGTLATLAGAETLTNKRINPRVKTLPYNDATITVGETTDYNADLADQFIITTGLSQDTLFGAPGGTPVDAQKLTFRILCDGTIRTLTWNAVFQPRGVALPGAITASKYIYVGFIYNTITSTWDCVASAQEA